MERKGSENSIESNVQSRRTFVKKALTGSALISLPAKGVWAGGHVNLNSSAAASGTGSDAGSVQTYTLMGPDYWRNNSRCSSYYGNKKFKDVFGQEAYWGKTSHTGKQYRDGSVRTINKYISDILAPTKDNFTGCNDYNRLVVALFMNAALSGDGECYYPVLESSQFYDEYDFARYLIDLTYSDPYGSATYLRNYIAEYSQYGW